MQRGPAERHETEGAVFTRAGEVQQGKGGENIMLPTVWKIRFKLSVLLFMVWSWSQVVAIVISFQIYSCLLHFPTINIIYPQLKHQTTFSRSNL